MKKVCHFTSVHKQLDDRIFLKECISLADNGYDVYIVAEGDDNEQNGVKIIGCGTPKNRIQRILKFSKIIYKKALELDCDVYHFHDPELLPFGIKLKKKGKVVIFDSHEDVAAQILDKYWIPFFIRNIVSKTYRFYETKVVGKLDAVITATKHISDEFANRARVVEVINNYPIISDIIYQTKDFELRDPNVVYAGGISEIRGEKVMIDSVKRTDAKLLLAGGWDNKQPFFDEYIEYLGEVTRRQVNEMYGNSICGILLYQPAKNHFESQPIKLFEYMAAGLPIICCNYPLWQELVEDNNCGICVSPADSQSVADAIRLFMNNRKLARQMGDNGHELVINKYNWDVEEQKLLQLYNKVLNND